MSQSRTPKSSKRHSPETAAVHAGEYEVSFHPVVEPIFQTSTFGFDDAAEGASLFAGERNGYIYSRMGNPTVEALERCVASLEGGSHSLACGSGMAAVHTALGSLLQSGDHVICSDSVYGPTCTLVDRILPRFGVEASVVDTSDVNAVAKAFRPNTKVLFVESPGNPTLVISDLAALSELAHRHGAQVVVDNTFMSPLLQRPFELGADVIVHSLTKFLNGHADVVGGIIVTRTEEQYVGMRKMLNHFGGVLAPFESFLVLRGIKTLALRMQRHGENALEVAQFLESHPAVSWVRYPGLPSHPQYELAGRQMGGGGGLITFEVEGGIEAGRHVMDHVSLWRLAVSLGGVESLIQHPATMTHASMGKEARERAGISDGLIRISVGIENVRDLIDDLGEVLAGVPGTRQDSRATIS